MTVYCFECEHPALDHDETGTCCAHPWARLNATIKDAAKAFKEFGEAFRRSSHYTGDPP